MIARALSLFGLFLVSEVTSAQDVHGRMEGRLRDEHGAALAGVQIVVSGDALFGTRAVMTDGTGRFRVHALPVGTYEVRARRLGYRPLVVTGVEVRLGETAMLGGIRLEAAPQQLPEQVVSARQAGAHRIGLAAGTVLGSDQLRMLPIGRNFRDIGLLMPHATPSYFGDAISIGGATGLENQYYVDGIKITSPVDGARSLDLPYNFIEQIELRTGGAMAEDEQSFGGVLNVVTPSGRNEFETSAFAFFSSDGLQRDGRAPAGATLGGFRSYDVGAAFSGPIVRDRLWFFAAYNPTSERRDHRFEFGGVELTTRSHQFAAKLTSTPGASTALSATVIGSPTRVEDIQYAPLSSSAATPLSADPLRVQGRRGGIAASVRGAHAIEPGLLLEAAVSMLDFDDEIEPSTEAGRSAWFFDAEQGTVSGGHGHVDDFRGGRRSAKADLSWQKGAMLTRVGAEFELVTLAREGRLHTITRASANDYVEFDAVITGGRAENRIPSMYAQTLWRATNRLSVHAGIRHRRQVIANGRTHRSLVRIRDGLQPRLGFSLDLDDRAASRVFGSFARVADEVSLWGLPSPFGEGYTAVTTYPQDPRIDSTGVDTSWIGFATVEYFSRRVRGSTADEWSAGYERDLGAFGRLTLRAIQRALNDTWEGTDFGVGNPGRGVLGEFPDPMRVYQAMEFGIDHESASGHWLRMSYVLSRTRGNHTGDYKTDYRLVTPNTGPQWGHPGQLVNATGLLPQDRTHVVKLMGARRWARMTLGADFIAASGTPLSEIGRTPEAPPPYLGFVSERGSAGRTPSIWDLGLRFGYDLPVRARGAQFTLLFDLRHLGSAQRAVDFDQLRFVCIEDGRPACPNATYGRVTQYQPPMSGRIGIEASF